MFFTLLLLFAGDFTYTAPDGCWLDYARSRAISKERFLIVEQTGEKGQYDLGAKQKVFDKDGVFLYEIPEAENAWMLVNGFLGDPDTFLFQTRNDPNWYAWHPAYGSRALYGDGMSPYEALQLNGSNLKYFKLLKNGRRIVFIRKPSYQTDRGTREKTLIEVIDFEVEPTAFFNSESVTPASHVKTVLDKDLNFHFDGAKLALYDVFANMPMFFTMDLDLDAAQIPMMEQKTAYRIHALAMEHGYVAYVTNQGYVLEKAGTAQPLFILRDKDNEKTNFNPFMKLFRAIGHGKVSEKEGILSYLDGSTQVVFDSNKKMLRHFYSESSLTGLRSSESTLEISCDHQSFKSRNVPPPKAQKKAEPVLELSAPMEGL